MDITIDELIIEKDRAVHIAKHDVTIEEVFEVLAKDHLILKGKLDRSLLVGKTANQRLITVIVAPRNRINVYGLVTARAIKKKEKKLYQERFEPKENKENES